MSNIIIKKLTEPNEEIIKTVYEKAGMTFDKANANFFSNNHNIFLVGYLDDALSGFVYAHILESPHTEYNQMFLYSIDVFPEFQNKGVGTALINELIKLRKEYNCCEMFVFTNDSNNKAKRLYEKTGGKRENPDDVMYVYEYTEL